MFRVIHRTVLVLVGLALPFEWINWTVAGIIITPTKILNALLLLVVVMQWSLGATRTGGDTKLRWIALLALSVAISTIDALLSGFSPAVLAITMTWVSLFVFYVLLVYILRTRADVEILVSAFLVGAIAVIAVSSAGMGFQTFAAQGARLGGEGGNPNMLAFNLVLGLPLAFALLFTARSRVAQVVYLAAVAVLLTGIIATLSRSAFLACAAMSLLWMVRFRRFDLLRYAVPVMAVFAIALYFAPPSFFERAASINPSHLDSSAESRIKALPVIWAAFSSHPIIGIGLGTFLEFTYSQVTTFHNTIHNAYLQVAAEQGLVGFIPFMAVIVLSWIQMSRCWRVSRRLRFLGDSELTKLGHQAVLLQVALAGLLVASLFQPSSRHKALWLAIALSTVFYRLTRRRVAELGPRATARPERSSASPAGVPLEVPTASPAPSFPR